MSAVNVAIPATQFAKPGTMVIRHELARRGDRRLREFKFIGVGGQIRRLSHEIDGPDKLCLATREEAQAAFLMDPFDAAA
jgi:hypothetical protein